MLAILTSWTLIRTPLTGMAGLRFINAQPFSSAANGSFSLAGLLSSITIWKSMPRPSVSQVRERLATGFTLDHLWRETMGLPKGDSKERALAMLTDLLRKELERSQWELYWRKHGPPTTAAAARQWWLTPELRPRDAAAVLKAAPDAVRRVCDREGLPPAWRA